MIKKSRSSREQKFFCICVDAYAVGCICVRTCLSLCVCVCVCVCVSSAHITHALYFQNGGYDSCVPPLCPSLSQPTEKTSMQIPPSLALIIHQSRHSSLFKRLSSATSIRITISTTIYLINSINADLAVSL